MGGAILDKIGRRGLSEEKRPWPWTKDQSPGTEAYMMCSRNSKKVGVAEAEWGKQADRGKVRDDTRATL